MRIVFDFLNGIAGGLRPHAAHTLELKAGRGRRRARKPGTLTGLGRFCLLLLVAGCAAAALLAAANAARPQPRFRTAAAPAAEESELSAPAAPALDDVLATDPAAPPREWKHIIIHHSGTLRGSAQSFDEHHRAPPPLGRGWRSLGYHFVIGNGQDQGDGAIAAGPRWYAQEAGAHANSSEFNEHGIGICLVGNFEDQPPTLAQWSALRALVKRLCEANHIGAENVLGHNQVRRGGSTACPGKLLSISELREGL